MAVAVLNLAILDAGRRRMAVGKHVLKRAVGFGDADFQWCRRLPPKGIEPGGVQQLLRCSIWQARVKHQSTVEANDAAEHRG